MQIALKREAPPPQLSFQLVLRLVLFAAVLAGELTAASMLFDSDKVLRSPGAPAGGLLAVASVWTAHFLVGFAAIFCTFFYLQYRDALSRLSAQANSSPVSYAMVAGHFVALAAFGACCFALERAGTRGVLLLPWLVAGIATLLFAALAFLPPRLWISTLRATRLLPIYAAGAAALAASAVQQSARLWLPLSGLTFSLVKALLSPVLPAMVVQPEHFRIGSTRFTAVISPACSGVEGAALLLVFIALWLIVFRKEIRLPQALLLVPVGVVILLLLNAVRIAALILIGHSGAREIAAQGFHSQAGWILFNSVAFGISVGARRIPWISRSSVQATATATRSTQDDAVSAYLIPFLAILLAGMLSRAASGNFEWTYGIRLFAVAIPLWIFRRSYSSLPREWDWRAPAAGAFVFALWIAMEKVFSHPSPMPAALSAASSGWRTAWIFTRAATAVTIVPFAEELAFRGYLMRRFMREDFVTVAPARASWLAVAASSLIFGALHGPRWAAGTMAGLVYSAVYRRRGNLWSAVVAHACTNLLLAIYVLKSGNWSLW